MDIRDRLVAAAIDLLATGGPDAVQTRKLAAEIGTSTMAVYTNFGGMAGLVQAIVAEGFTRLGHTLATVERTDDPMADLVALGGAYRDHAITNPELYRVMFGVTAINGHRAALGDPTAATETESPEPHDPHAGEAPDAPDDTAAAALATFDVLAEFVAAVIDRGLVRPDDPRALAAQLWSATHGFVLLEIAGFHGADGAERVLRPMIANLLAGAAARPD
ncbi:TetR/AcrR family transcriptional regulator [Actinokineospora iranica]|uniref:DNA-binding transcriptional regulator, AcrR family n=1 Tax=Actinokineospora iranica TaxID=1271860 RepID=A0A1G6INT6_9PSEU|nr:TetR/AcrR family transcriptional regulator [Actinokineospora iranica]SDC08159.1 DNA-binding transcriptional regulator, AcrR family [Actinokineospora iranica]